MVRVIAAVVAAAAGLLVPALYSRAADGPVVPSWMTVNAARKQVRMDMVAAWNSNNGGLNFNGYHGGALTVVVPVGWSVQIKFSNNDGMLPHSLLLTKAYAPGDFPQVADVKEVAIPRAYSINPDQGFMAPQTDTLDFTVRNEGKFYLFCGVAAHGVGGMWDRFDVVTDADTPQVRIAEEAEPGRT